MKKIIASAAIFMLLNSSLLGSVPLHYNDDGNGFSPCGKDITVSFVPASKKTYEPNDKDIEIVFDGVFVEYAFEQLGYIEVYGADSSGLNNLINCIKSTAAQKGADAVINIKRQNRGSQSTFSGILIKYVNDEQSENSSATESKKRVTHHESTGLAKFLTFIAGAFILSIVIYSELQYRDDNDERY